jgi:hypothetical protein
MLDEYVPNVHIAHAEVDGIFTKDESIQKQLEEKIAVTAFEIGEQGRDLEDWTALLGNTSRAPLKAVPPIVPSRISTRGKSKAPFQFTLDHVVPFFANLRNNLIALHMRRGPLWTNTPSSHSRDTSKQRKQCKMASTSHAYTWTGETSKKRRV